MPAIGRHPLPPPSSLLGGSLRRPKRPYLPLLAAGNRRRPSRHLRVEAVPQAAVSSAALHLAFDAPTPAGDVSVLIPISTVLLVVYWVANFVVPEMISKGLQRGESGEDILGETTGAKVADKVAMPSKPTAQSNKSRGVKSSRR